MVTLGQGIISFFLFFLFFPISLLLPLPLPLSLPLPVPLLSSLCPILCFFPFFLNVFSHNYQQLGSSVPCGGSVRTRKGLLWPVLIEAASEVSQMPIPGHWHPVQSENLYFLRAPNSRKVFVGCVCVKIMVVKFNIPSEQKFMLDNLYFIYFKKINSRQIKGSINFFLFTVAKNLTGASLLISRASWY